MIIIIQLLLRGGSTPYIYNYLESHLDRLALMGLAEAFECECEDISAEHEDSY